MAAVAPRRPTIIFLGALLVCGVVDSPGSKVTSFVNGGLRRGEVVRGSRVARANTRWFEKGQKRRDEDRRLRFRRTWLVEEQRETIGDYVRALGPVETDKPFNVASATGKTVTVVFKVRPTGILRFKQGDDGKGAMVMQVGKPFFKGDCHGQAWEAGVRPGMVVTSVGDKTIINEPFGEIVTMIGDAVLGSWMRPVTSMENYELKARREAEARLPMKPIELPRQYCNTYRCEIVETLHPNNSAEHLEFQAPMAPTQLVESPVQVLAAISSAAMLITFDGRPHNL